MRLIIMMLLINIGCREASCKPTMDTYLNKDKSAYLHVAWHHMSGTLPHKRCNPCVIILHPKVQENTNYSKHCSVSLFKAPCCKKRDPVLILHVLSGQSKASNAKLDALYPSGSCNG